MQTHHKAKLQPIITILLCFQLSTIFFSSHLLAAEMFASSENSFLTKSAKSKSEPPDALEYEILIAEIILNAQATGAVSIIGKDSDGKLYVDKQDLIAWEIQAPYPDPILIEGQEFIPLAPFGQLETEFDSDNLVLSISLSSKAFGKQIIDLAGVKKDLLPRSDTGFFLNYDVSIASESNSETNASALLDSVFFAKNAHAINSMIFQSDVPEDGNQLLRLDTRIQKDFPEWRTSAIVGDSITASSSWGRQVRFAGVQYGTDFNTQPRFISFPLPITEGEAAVPSEIDIFVNNRLVRSVDTEPGLFEIRNVPTISGDGEIQLIVRDALGRESIVTSDFYSTDVLLKDGLSNYSYSLGVLRENYALQSNDYSSAMLVGDHQYGLSDTATVGARIEVSDEIKNLGLNGTVNLANKGILSSSLALSSSNIQDSSLKGTLWRLAYRYNNERFRLSTGYQNTNPDFRYFGINNPEDSATHQLNLNAGVRFDRYGSLGLGFVTQDFSSQASRQITSLNYQTTIPKWFTVSAFMNNISVAGESNRSFGLLFTRSFGKRRTASMDLNSGEDFTWQSQYRQNLPFGEGYGYRVAAGQNPNTNIEADWEQKLAKLFYSVEARRGDNSTGLRANAAGAIAKLDSHISPTRDVRDAFAVVKVADYPNVGVYQENQPIGYTNSNGELLVPGLRPYDINKLRIEAKDLPIDAEIDELETSIAPYRNSGVKVNFAVKRSLNYTLIAQHPELDEIPAGAEILIVDSQGLEESVSILGYDNLVFFTGKEGIASILLRWNDQECSIRLNPDEINQIIKPGADLLTLNCTP